MAEDTKVAGGLTGAMPITVVLAMLVSLVFTHYLPYKDERPTNKPISADYQAAQDVDSRLWQDPFAAVEAASVAPETEKVTLVFSHKNQTLRLEATRPNAKPPSHGPEQIYFGKNVAKISDMTVIAVTLPGEPYQEAAEQRMRRRYAVLSGLANQIHTPDDEQHIGYFQPTGTYGLQKRVAFEWWSGKSADEKVLLLWVDESSLFGHPAAKLKALLEQVIAKAKPKKISYTVIGPNTSSLLRDMLREVNDQKQKTNPTVPDCVDKPGKHSRVSKSVIINSNCITYYAAGATAPDADLLAGVGETRETGETSVTQYLYKRGITLHRTTATDDQMMEVLAKELSLRQVKLPTNFQSQDNKHGLNEIIPEIIDKCEKFFPLIKYFRTKNSDSEGDNQSQNNNKNKPNADSYIDSIKDWFKNKITNIRDFLELAWKKGTTTLRPIWYKLTNFVSSFLEKSKEQEDHIVILSEWDTFYGQTIHKSFKEKSEIKPENLHVFGYMRGLDGKLPDKGDKSATTVVEKKSDTKDKSDAAALIEPPEGQNQKDYLRRLAEHIADLDRQFKNKGDDKGIAAIGVLGSDVHDKLMILEALRQYFPHKLFFTTDLDASYSHPAKRPLTHNLLVATAFGLTLQPKLQGKIPPFRDTYQTAIFFATQKLLRDRVLGIEQVCQSPFKNALHLVKEPDSFQKLYCNWQKSPLFILDGFYPFPYFHMETKDTRIANLRNYHLPRLFEIGRNRPIPLPTEHDTVIAKTNDNNEPKCSSGCFSECKTVQPDILATLYFDSEIDGVGKIIVMITILLLVLSSWVRERAWQFVVGASMALPIFYGALFIYLAFQIYWLLGLIILIVIYSVVCWLWHKGINTLLLLVLFCLVLLYLAISYYWLLALIIVLPLFFLIHKFWQKSMDKTPQYFGAVVGLALFLLYLVSDFWNEYNISPDTEPFYWLEGVSAWPSQLLRLSVILFAGGFWYWGHKRIQKMQEDLQWVDGLKATFALPKQAEAIDFSKVWFISCWQSDNDSDITVSPRNLWKKYLGYCSSSCIKPPEWFLEFFGLINWLWSMMPNRLLKFIHILGSFFGYCKQKISGLPDWLLEPIKWFLQPISLLIKWSLQKMSLLFSGPFLRVFLHCGLFILAAWLIIGLGDLPNVPIRGGFAHDIHYWILIPSIGATFWLITWVVENARLCERLIAHLSAKPSLWHKEATDWAINHRKVAPECVHDWLDVHLVARLTATMQPLIFGPVLCIALLIMARSPAIDDWDVPWGLELIYIIMLLYAISAEVFLQRGATIARTKALNQLIDKISAERNLGKPDEVVIKRIESEIERIRNLREGAFRPWYEWPLLQSFGGFGSLWVALQYLAGVWGLGL